MSTLVGLHDTRVAWEMPPVKPLDESVWQAWVAKGRAQDARSSAVRHTAVKWVSIAGLIAATGLWSRITPYEVVVRFIVAAGAVLVMLQAFQSRHYAFAAVFGTLALVYNPVAPVFSFSGDWQRVAVLASTVPFLSSLGWRDGKLAENDND